MKRAWEMARELFLQARPVVRSAEEQTWEDNLDVSLFYDQNLMLDWSSNVPGSGAPEHIMVAAVQALENRGYKVSEEGYRYLNDGLKAAEQKDYVLLHQYSALLRRELAKAEKDQKSDYWNYKYYRTFEDYHGAVTFPDRVPIRPDSEIFRNQVRAGWLGQLIGGAMGTMVEGYSSESILDAFGEVREYIREPNTYNDDTTYEIAFLDAFSKKGYTVTSEDIALSWVGLIPCDWRKALAECEEKYRKYNWIHAYPNACCEVIALYYGEGDFSETLHIVTMCGLDADCNAGMVMPIVAIREGCSSIPEKYIHPAFDKLTTYMRGKMCEITMDALVEKTVQSVISYDK